MPRPRGRPEESPTVGSTAHVVRQVMTLIDTFVESRRRDRLSRTLVRLALEVDGVDDAAVVEVRDGDELEVMAFSSEDVRHLTGLQLTDPTGGPAVGAVRSGEPALLERHQGGHQWALLQPFADELGHQYAYAIPMRRRSETLGSLVLYGRDVRGLDDAGRQLLETLAQIAAIGLAQARAVRAANERADQLKGALTTRAVIEQAKGVLLAQGYPDPDAAFEALRGHARTHRRRLDEVARDVVQGASSGERSPVLPRQRVDKGSGEPAPADPRPPRRRR